MVYLPLTTWNLRTQTIILSSSDSMMKSWYCSSLSNCSTLLIWSTWRLCGWFWRRICANRFSRFMFTGWLWFPLTFTMAVWPFTLSVMILARHLRLPWKSNWDLIFILELKEPLEFVTFRNNRNILEHNVNSPFDCISISFSVGWLNFSHMCNIHTQAVGILSGPYCT